MKERPILMSAPMVRACLDGSKTQMRRILKPQPPAATVQVSTYHHPKDHERPYFWAWVDEGANVALDDWAHPCPYGKPGDRLRVREAWSHDGPDLATVRSRMEDALLGGETYGPYYRATEAAPDTLKWIPSIHMPRWACRLELEITGVRVERLQDCSEADARAEGAAFHDGHGVGHSGWRHDAADGYVWDTALASYRCLWDQINGAGAWEANPWVWVVEFKRMKP